MAFACKLGYDRVSCLCDPEVWEEPVKSDLNLNRIQLARQYVNLC